LFELEPELKKIAKRYYISGSDPQDVLQEGRIGVWKAVQDFDENKDTTFKNFALNLVVKRHVITAVAAANRKKFDLHNNAASLDTAVWTGEDDSEQSLGDFIADTETPLLDQMLQREEYEENSTKVTKRLTPLERAIFLEYSCEESYKDIAEALDIKPKAVDNALMRIRKKANDVWTQYEKATKENQ
jgi:RNA polymerase sporulation-specific sigma factor